MSYGTHATTGGAIDEIDHIRQSVRDILSTPLGSRVMRRSYGSLLPDLIDQPMHGATRLRLYTATYMALLKWEPRVRLSAVRLVDSSAVSGVFSIELQAQRLRSGYAASLLTFQIALKA